MKNIIVIKEIDWIASIYHSVEDMQRYSLRDYALELENTMSPISIRSHSLKEGIHRFTNTKAFKSFWSIHKNINTVYFYYVNQDNQIILYDEFIT